MTNTMNTVREALEAERRELVAENEAATSWGAAVGARHERIKAIDRRLRSMSAINASPGLSGPVEMVEMTRILRESCAPMVEAFTNGGCVQFVMAMQALNPRVECLYDFNHAIARLDGVCWDVTGIIEPNKHQTPMGPDTTPLEWERMIALRPRNAALTTPALAQETTPTSPRDDTSGEAVAWYFDRYINGTLMAEGVTIERQAALPAAMREAVRIAARGPNGEMPVLVLRTHPADREDLAAKLADTERQRDEASKRADANFDEALERGLRATAAEAREREANERADKEQESLEMAIEAIDSRRLGRARYIIEMVLRLRGEEA